MLKYILLTFLNKQNKLPLLRSDCIVDLPILKIKLKKFSKPINITPQITADILLVSRVVRTNKTTLINLSMSKFISHLNFQYNGFKMEWTFVNTTIVAKKTKFYRLFFKFLKKKYVKFLYITKFSLYSLYLQLCFAKSPIFLINVLQRRIIKLPVKRHRSFFRKIREIIRFWYFLIAGTRTVRGYTIFFKGKLGRKGSVRKKKIFVKEGLTSFTNKSLRINYKNFILWTDTGVVGANISIFF